MDTYVIQHTLTWTLHRLTWQIYYYYFCLQCLDTVEWAAGRASGLWKNGRGWRWALVSQDGVAPSRMVGVSASVNLPLHHKVQKFSSGTGSPGWSRKKGRKTVVVWCVIVVLLLLLLLLLSLLFPTGREMSPGQSAVMPCSWGIKAG